VCPDPILDSMPRPGSPSQGPPREVRSASRPALPRGRLLPTRRGLLQWLAVVGTVGLLLFAYHHLAVLAEGARVDFRKPLINELTAAFGAGLLFFPLRWLVETFPLATGHRLARGPLYLAALLAFSVCHTSSNWLLRSLLYPVAGLGAYDYGVMPLRYAMEFPVDVIVFTLMAGVLHAVRHLRLARARELDAERLALAVSQARLQSLRHQLQPHFLFNTLNTISSTLYRDVDAADQMIEHLADLLRVSLGRDEEDGKRDEVPLADELELLDTYLALMRARFEDRLEVTVAATPEARRVPVPPLLLQPLVENAIRHGGAETRGHGRIAVRAWCDEGLVIEVSDDGPGGRVAAVGATHARGGVGLANTAERLRLLYGGAGRFVAGPRPEGGYRVRIEIPRERR